MEDVIKERLKKVYELVNNGATEGEKTAAKAALDRLINKYNINSDELNNIDLNDYIFKYTSNLELWLLNRLRLFFIERHTEVYRHSLAYTKDGKGLIRVKNVSMKLAYAEYITIECAYEYFRRHMNTQFKKICIPVIKKIHNRNRRNKRRLDLQTKFFGKYIIESKLCNPSEIELKVVKGKEQSDIYLLDDVEGGVYNKQVARGLYLE